MTINLNDTLDQVSGNVQAVVSDPSGNVLGTLSGITFSATPIVVEPIDPSAG